MQRILESISVNLKSQLFFLMFYFFIFFFIFMVLQSLVYYFHFLLEHDIQIIEDWIYYEIWKILLVSQVVSLYLFVKIVEIYIGGGKLLLQIFKHAFYPPKREYYVVISFFLFIFTIQYMTAQDVRWGNTFSFFSLFWNLLGILSLYFPLSIIKFILHSAYPLEFKEKTFILFTAFFSQVVLLSFMIPTMNVVNIFYMLSFLLTLISLNWRKIGLTHPLMILLLPAINSLLFGNDPIWRGDYLIIRQGTEQDFFIWPITFTVVFVYLYKTRRPPA